MFVNALTNCCYYSSDHMVGELDGNHVRSSNTSSGTSEKAQRRVRTASLKPFLIPCFPPTYSYSFLISFSLGGGGRMSVNRKWEVLRQIGWPLVGARAGSDPKLWEEPRTHASPGP